MPTKHGHTKQKRPSPEYTSWVSMKKRCYYPKTNGYKNYGGKGIKVCERWKYSFENFLLDMGNKPTLNHTLDRHPNRSGDYEPTNCRWATKKEQQDNKDRRIQVSIDEKNMLLSSLEINPGLNYKTVARRIGLGWEVSRAIESPKLFRIKMGVFGKPIKYIHSELIYNSLYNIMIINKIPIARLTSNGITNSILIKWVAKYKTPNTIRSGKDNQNSKLIEGVNLATNEVKLFYGLKEAATYIGSFKSNVSATLSGENRTCKGWRLRHF